MLNRDSEPEAVAIYQSAGSVKRLGLLLLTAAIGFAVVFLLIQLQSPA
ncbi:MAG: hypothetical protein ACFCU2_12585 [Acidimicrobiia bacterium]